MSSDTGLSTPFGWRGQILPGEASIEPFKATVADGIELGVFDDVLHVGYQRAEDEVRALDYAHRFVKAWSFGHDTAVSVQLNQSWRIDPDGRKHFAVHLSAVASAGGSGSVSVLVVDSNGIVIEQPNHDLLVAVKAVSDPALSKALDYYVEEVIEDDRPLYGIYKAIEELCTHLGRDGRARLGKFAGYEKGYVDDLMETTQLQRHARTSARRRLSDQECCARGKTLIHAYADSLPDQL